MRRSTLTIGVIVQSIHSEREFWRRIREGVDCAAGEIRDMGVDVQWHALSEDLGEQTAKIEKMIQDGVSAIALAVTGPAAIRETIDSAVDCGIDVVTFTMDAPSSKRRWHVG